MDAVPFPRANATCHHCQAALPVNAKFCPSCGYPLAVPSGQPHPLQVICPTCAHTYPDTYSFCPEDGSKLRLAPG